MTTDKSISVHDDLTAFGVSCHYHHLTAPEEVDAIRRVVRPPYICIFAEALDPPQRASSGKCSRVRPVSV
ncbi:MAG: hypothetical protein H0T64_14170 [Pyrinomonadaceae bacterium]|nr:hypothetical protein [Pyrinomonadaceae bacterium]